VADLLDSFADEIAALLGISPAEWLDSPQVQGLLARARPRGFSVPDAEYLQYMHPQRSGHAKALARLRELSKIGARTPKNRLTLLPAKPPT
jgi:hypothetical protein